MSQYWENIRTRQDLRDRYFTPEYPGEPMTDAQDTSVEDRAAMYGMPDSGEAQHRIQPLAVPGAGPDGYERMSISRGVHELLAPLYLSVYRRIAQINSGRGSERYEIRSLGGYFPRYMKNPTTWDNIHESEDYAACRAESDDWDSDYTSDAYDWDRERGQLRLGWLSNHSFGNAVDFNAGANPFDREAEGLRFNMPPWVVQIYLEHGFYWGGFYLDRHHFEYLRPAVTEPPVYDARSFVFPVDATSADELYALNEGGEHGFFPVGTSRVWHGGVHLPTGGDVRCIADGTVVCARLPSEDPLTPDDGQTSRNFVLVRHALRAPGEQDLWSPVKWVWSLYYHLEAYPLDREDEEAQRLSWIMPLLRHSRPDLELDPGRRYFEIVTNEDSGGLNMRERSNGGSAIQVIPQGEVVEILTEGPLVSNRIKVRSAVYERISSSHQDHVEEVDGEERVWGYIYVVWEDEQRVRLIDKNQQVAGLAQGRVVKLDEPVLAGDLLGKIGKHLDTDTLHVEVFSEEPLDHLAGLAALRRWEDPDRDAVLDVAELVEQFEDARDLWGSDADAEESKRAAPQLRDVAALHCSPWAVSDWSPLQGSPWELDPDEVQELASRIGHEQWWQEAVEAGVELPASPVVWHYHPVKLIEILQETFAAQPNPG